MLQKIWAAVLGIRPGPHRGAYGDSLDTLAGGERVCCPLLKNPTPRLGFPALTGETAAFLTNGTLPEITLK